MVGGYKVKVRLQALYSVLDNKFIATRTTDEETSYRLYCHVWFSRLLALIEHIESRSPDFFDHRNNLVKLADIILHSDTALIQYPPFRIYEAVKNPKYLQKNILRVLFQFLKRNFISLFNNIKFLFLLSLYSNKRIVIAPKDLRACNLRNIFSEKLGPDVKFEIIYKNSYLLNNVKHFIEPELMSIFISSIEHFLNQHCSKSSVINNNDKALLICAKKLLEYFSSITKPNKKKYTKQIFSKLIKRKIIFLNYDNSVFRDMFLHKLSYSVSCDIVAFQHGGGHYLIDSFTFADPFLKPYNKRFYDVLGFGNKYQYVNPNMKEFIKFKQPTVFYPQSLEFQKKISAKVAGKSYSNTAKTIMDALMMSGSNFYARAHPLGEGSDSTNLRPIDYQVSGRRPRLESGIRLVIFDSPDASLIREVCNASFPYLFIFNPSDFTLTEIGESFFASEKARGRFVPISGDIETSIDAILQIIKRKLADEYA